MWRNCLSIPKLQRWNRWRLGMDKYFHPTLYWICNYLSMLRLKLTPVSHRGPCKAVVEYLIKQITGLTRVSLPKGPYPTCLRRIPSNTAIRSVLPFDPTPYPKKHFQSELWSKNHERCRLPRIIYPQGMGYPLGFIFWLFQQFCLV